MAALRSLWRKRSEGNRSVIVRLRFAFTRHVASCPSPSFPPRTLRPSGSTGHLTSEPHHNVLVPGRLTLGNGNHVGAMQICPRNFSPEPTWSMFTRRFSPRTPSTPSSTTSSAAPITSAAAPHLALFHSLSDHIRSNPEFVIERITEWLCAPDPPRTWAILALCLRATAHETVDANRAALEDYGRVLVLWSDLLNDLGFDKVRRWKVNMQFADSRFRSLGGDVDSTFGLPLWRPLQTYFLSLSVVEKP